MPELSNVAEKLGIFGGSEADQFNKKWWNFINFSLNPVKIPWTDTVFSLSARRPFKLWRTPTPEERALLKDEKRDRKIQRVLEYGNRKYEMRTDTILRTRANREAAGTPLAKGNDPYRRFDKRFKYAIGQSEQRVDNLPIFGDMEQYEWGEPLKPRAYNPWGDSFALKKPRNQAPRTRRQRAGAIIPIIQADPPELPPLSPLPSLPKPKSRIKPIKKQALIPEEKEKKKSSRKKISILETSPKDKYSWSTKKKEPSKRKKSVEPSILEIPHLEPRRSKTVKNTSSIKPRRTRSPIKPYPAQRLTKPLSPITKPSSPVTSFTQSDESEFGPPLDPSLYITPPVDVDTTPIITMEPSISVVPQEPSITIESTPHTATGKRLVRGVGKSSRPVKGKKKTIGKTTETRGRPTERTFKVPDRLDLDPVIRKPRSLSPYEQPAGPDPFWYGRGQPLREGGMTSFRNYNPVRSHVDTSYVFRRAEQERVSRLMNALNINSEGAHSFVSRWEGNWMPLIDAGTNIRTLARTRPDPLEVYPNIPGVTVEGVSARERAIRSPSYADFDWLRYGTRELRKKAIWENTPFQYSTIWPFDQEKYGDPGRPYRIGRKK